ncbi:response regulator transcription factor [Vallitalea okinawensis]|uniref:response regulator transcription factor n=1 Tax=Vallitalea okinawensis TaxID=2078660 RepID=UPI000CFB9354|nr:response regulator transcription factor [Vallitalea okinawensis]
MNILVVEDDKKMNKLIKDYLLQEEYKVFSAYDGEEALTIFDEENIDLVILDVMIPKLDGFSVCRRLRNKSDVLIVIVSARSEEDDKLMGFEYGADEYVVKPFSPKVLLARVNALIKRVFRNKDKDIISKGIITIETNKLKVTVSKEAITLTAREYDLLLELVNNEGYVYSRDKLINLIWEYDYFGDGRIVDTNIKMLRKKLKEASKYIITVVGKGYKFEVTE